jgi:uncharacterized membrane protein
MGIDRWVAELESVSRPGRLGGPGDQTGLLVAAAVAPGTFEPSLVPRNLLDQAIVTGIGTTLSYVLTVTTQDVIDALTSGLAGRDSGTRQRWWTLALDLGVIPIGIAANRLLTRRPDESLLRGIVRQIAWRTSVTGFGASVFTLTEVGLTAVDRAVGGGGRIARIPLGAPVGLAIGLALEAGRRRGLPEESTTTDAPAVEPLRAAAASAGVSAAVTAAALLERMAADATGALLATWLPGGRLVWRLVGHGLTVAALVGAGTVVWHRAIRSIEAGTNVVEPIIDDQGGRRWVGRSASGSAESLVQWASLGREGRRHVLLYPRPRPVKDLPVSLPDLAISSVMGEPAVAEPALVYVGLDSAPNIRARVDLALAEMDRVGAWDRSMIMLCSPTGSGYVNYCATAAASYLTRGDVAIVTMQYSKRPSPLSLFKIKDAREQNRLLWLAISARLRDRPGRRPRVVLFGESLGAHTSQDVLLHWGTLGPQALGIDRALWIGTPYGSGWMHQVTGSPRPDVDPRLVTMVNDFDQLLELTPEHRAALRYVMVSHDNDGVTKFGVDLLARRPAWLTDQRPKIEIVAGASPRGVPARLRWRPVTTFLHSLIDMKNAQKMEGYRAWAHDYRPDIARFIAEVYKLPATSEQMARIERALQAREEIRDKVLSQHLEAMNPQDEPA